MGIGEALNLLRDPAKQLQVRCETFRARLRKTWDTDRYFANQLNQVSTTASDTGA